MQNQPAENEWLIRARQAAKQGNGTATHMYYSTYLLRNPDSGAIFIECLSAMRALPGANRQLMDVSVQNALSRLLPSQPPLKVIESGLEKLRAMPCDLDAVCKIARSAQTAGWHTLAIAAITDILKLSPAAKTAGSKLARELKLSLGQSHYQLNDYKAAFETLKEFEQDPAAGKDILQMLKDAAASLASATFAQKDSAHQIATAPSLALATHTPQQKAEQELSELLAILNDNRTDNTKLCSAALRLADIYLRSQNYDKALEVLNNARERTGNNGDLAKKHVEVNVRRRDDAIAAARAIPGNQAQELSLNQLIADREAFIVQAYTELAALLPTDGEVHLRLGEGLYAKSRRNSDEAALKDAIGHLQFEFKTDEQFNQSRLLLAECFLALQLPAAAEIVLSEFLSRIDSTRKGSEYYLEAQYLLGVVRERLKDPRGAMTAYMTVIGRNIKFKDAFERLRKLDAGRALSA